MHTKGVPRSPNLHANKSRLSSESIKPSPSVSHSVQSRVINNRMQVLVAMPHKATWKEVLQRHTRRLLRNLHTSLGKKGLRMYNKGVVGRLKEISCSGSRHRSGCSNSSQGKVDNRQAIIAMLAILMVSHSQRMALVIHRTATTESKPVHMSLLKTITDHPKTT